MRPLDIEYITKKLIFLARYSYKKGYVYSKGGNISGRKNYDMLIKRSGVSFRNLKAKDIILVRDFHKKEKVRGVSIDYMIHREIYLKTNANYVLHCHPPIIVKYTLDTTEEHIYPRDLEGRYYLKSGIPIVKGEHSNIYNIIGELAKSHYIIIEKGHGIYIWGHTEKDVLNMLEMATEVVSHIL